jgi:hypothetical protein
MVAGFHTLVRAVWPVDAVTTIRPLQCAAQTLFTRAGGAVVVDSSSSSIGQDQEMAIWLAA